MDVSEHGGAYGAAQHLPGIGGCTASPEDNTSTGCFAAIKRLVQPRSKWETSNAIDVSEHAGLYGLKTPPRDISGGSSLKDVLSKEEGHGHNDRRRSSQKSDLDTLHNLLDEAENLSASGTRLTLV
jgi:hypothetical protein